MPAGSGIKKNDTVNEKSVITEQKKQRYYLYCNLKKAYFVVLTLKRISYA